MADAPLFEAGRIRRTVELAERGGAQVVETVLPFQVRTGVSGIGHTSRDLPTE